jgi:hypothetical protein
MRVCGRRIRTWKVVSSMVLISVIALSASVWVISDLDPQISSTPVIEKNIVVQSSVFVKEDIPPTPVDYIRDMEDDSSEKKGEWLGLCPKGSSKSVESFRDQVNSDIVLANHFNDFRWDKAEVKVLKVSAKVKVTHRKDEYILPSKKYITLSVGDGYITDGRRIVRTHCCNDVKPENEDDFQPYTPAPKGSVPAPETISYVAPPHMSEYMDAPGVTEFDTYSNYGYSSGGGGSRRIYNPPKPPVVPPPETPVPEPETLVLFGVGILGILVSKKFLTRDNK